MKIDSANNEASDLDRIAVKIGIADPIDPLNYTTRYTDRRIAEGN